MNADKLREILRIEYGMHKITIDDVPERYQAAVKALLKADA